MKYRIICGDFLELRYRRMLVDRNVGASPRCSLQIGLEDWRTPVNRDLFEADFHAPTIANECHAVGCPYVPDPLHIVAQHGNQVALFIDDGDHNWQNNG